MFDKQNMHLRYLRTLEKIRSFLLSKKSREFLIFLFFVFMSFSFWLLQVLNDDYETELRIPLKMKNVPEKSSKKLFRMNMSNFFICNFMLIVCYSSTKLA